MTPVLLSWSGGKDAAWALHVLRQRGELDVVGLVTTVTEGFERISMQGIRVDVMELQAQATGLPVLQARIPQACDNATYEAAFASTLENARVRWPGLRDIAFGVYDETQRTESLVILIELDTKQNQIELRTQLQLTLRDKFGFGAHAITFVPPGSLPRTTSGKLKRLECRNIYLQLVLTNKDKADIEEPVI